MLITTPCLAIDDGKDDDDDSWQFIRSAHICLPRCGQGGGGVCGSPPRHWWCAQGTPRKPEMRKMRRMVKIRMRMVVVREMLMNTADIWPGCCSADFFDTNFVSHHPCESMCSLKILLEGYTS